METALMANYGHPELEFDHGKGCYLYTADGTPYLDFTMGVAVNSLGHCHPALIRALKDQADRLWHCSNLFRIAPAEALAAKLTATTFADRVFFSNSGTEAVEAGFKMMRRYHYNRGDTQKRRIIAFSDSFHGRTLAPVAACMNPLHSEGFLLGDQGFDQVRFGDTRALQGAINDHTAGIVIEPVQGEGGVRVASAEYLATIRKLCDDNGLLLMYDEVQCGAGRTGSLYAYQQLGTAPDLLASAKGLGGGFPIGACLATERVAAPMVAGTHGSTFGGNPLATAVGNVVIDEIMAPGFLDNVHERARHLRNGLDRLVALYPSLIAGYTGMGLMIGLQCLVPNTELLDALQQRRMLVAKAGGNSLRLLPPLNINAEDIDNALTTLDQACRAISDRRKE